VEAINSADVALAATVMDAGTVRAAALSATEIAMPPAGAALEIATVQEVLALGARLDEAHCKAVNAAGAVTAIDAMAEEPFREMVPAVALNVALVALAGTVTDAGTVRAARLSERLTAAPPAGADFESVTVQVVLAFALRADAAHCSPVTRGGALSVKEKFAKEPFSDAVTVAV
jgi:hypothetical protein